MTDEDHRALAVMLNGCKSAIVLSGYDSPLYDDLYKGWEKVVREIANHAAGGKLKNRQRECLWIKTTKVRRRGIRGEESAILPIPRR
jgi:DNA adenine methylase